MKISKRGLELIEEFEGFRPYPYKCSAGVWTIGIGTTVYPYGRKVGSNDPYITKEDAYRFLEADLLHREKEINSLIEVVLNQNQYDAIVSFVYNVGIGAFKKSTLLRKLNANPCDPTIAYEFSRWNKVNREVSKGLTRRRDAESDLYFSKR
jgi:lysozyme